MRKRIIISILFALLLFICSCPATAMQHSETVSEWIRREVVANTGPAVKSSFDKLSFIFQVRQNMSKSGAEEIKPTAGEREREELSYKSNTVEHPVVQSEGNPGKTDNIMRDNESQQEAVVSARDDPSLFGYLSLFDETIHLYVPDETHSAQSIVDAKQSAAFINGYIIADHNNQEFRELSDVSVGSVASISANGSSTEFICAERLDGTNNQGVVTADDGRDVCCQ